MFRIALRAQRAPFASRNVVTASFPTTAEIAANAALPPAAASKAEPQTSRAEKMMRRFWKTVALEKKDDGRYGVMLDKRNLRTPGGLPLLLERERLPVAILIAEEWENQVAVLKPHTLPMTSITSRALDGLGDAAVRKEVADGLIRYLGTDTVCFHEDYPQQLVALQDEHWKPLIAWVSKTFDVKVDIYEGILGNKQPADTVAKLAAVVGSYDQFKLAAFERAVLASKSYLIALALVEGHYSVDDAAKAAHVEVQSQINKWGEVEDTPTLVEHTASMDPTPADNKREAGISAGKKEDSATDSIPSPSSEDLPPFTPLDQQPSFKRAPTRVTIHSESATPQARPDENAPTKTPSTPFPNLNRSGTGASSNRPYSVFSIHTKWLIVGLGGIAAMLSPISSNIFVPAIPTLVTQFGKTSEEISLAVTIYLVFQAITPSFFGSMSDSFGRRPIYVGTLVVYLGANIGLALCPTDAYWLLMVLRALQATGGSAVVSIGAGAVADVAEPRERGKFMSVFQAGTMIGPAVGPLLGGIFASTLGWRAIFWFLTITTGVVLVPLIFIFPETLRSMVGDGSIPPPALCQSPMMLIRHRREKRDPNFEPEDPIERPPTKPYQPLSAFYILFTPEILLVFLFVSLLYLQFYCVLTIYSTALSNTYGLSELQIGLCYLPSGVGSIVSSLLNGRQLDYYYRKEEERVGGDFRKKPQEFRIHLTRIRCIVPFMCCFLFASTALGWCLEAHAPLAATLVVNFFVGLGTGTIGTATVYGQDLKPGQGGAVSASLNLVRCLFGAAGTAVVQIIYRAIGAGWTFVLFSGIVILGIPMPLAVLKYAPGWRQKREEKVEAKKLVGIQKEGLAGEKAAKVQV